jgi:hypothetical protein
MPRSVFPEESTSESKNAVKESIPLTTVLTILKTQCQLEVSYNNLRGWIHRQPEFRKSAEVDDIARSQVMLSE